MPTCELRAQAKNAAPDLSQLPSPQELAGKAQGAADDVSGKAKGAADQAVGSASGAAEQAKGSASGAANKVWSKIFFTWSVHDRCSGAGSGLSRCVLSIGYAV